MGMVGLYFNAYENVTELEGDKPPVTKPVVVSRGKIVSMPGSYIYQCQFYDDAGVATKKYRLAHIEQMSAWFLFSDASSWAADLAESKVETTP
jgi:hypothetical protein